MIDAPPPIEDLRPISTGDQLPVLRTTVVDADANLLADRALALGCVMTDDGLEARAELLDWASMALEGPYEPAPDTPPFHAELYPQYQRSGPAPQLELRAARPDGWEPDSTPIEDADGIGTDAALAIADDVLARMADVGLISDLPYALVRSTAKYRRACFNHECVPVFTETYVFNYSATYGGITILGTGIEVNVLRDGTVEYVNTTTLYLSREGEATAVSSESDAAIRFDENWPGRESDVTDGDVAYIARRPDAAMSAPVWTESVGYVDAPTAPQRTPDVPFCTGSPSSTRTRARCHCFGERRASVQTSASSRNGAVHSR